MKEEEQLSVSLKLEKNLGSRGGQEERKQWVTSSWLRPLSKGWKRPLLHLGTNLLTQRPCHTFTVLSTLLTRRHSNCQTEEGNNLHSYVIAGQRAATKHFTSSTLHVTGKKVESAKTKQIRELLLESGQQLEGGGGQSKKDRRMREVWCEPSVPWCLHDGNQCLVLLPCSVNAKYRQWWLCRQQ